MWNNSVSICGNLTDDPVLKNVNEKVVCNFTIALNRPAKDRETPPDYISCVVWNQPASYLERYGAKGSKVSLDGNLRTRSYENRAGQKVYITEVQVESLHVFRRNTPAPEKPA